MTDYIVPKKMCSICDEYFHNTLFPNRTPAFTAPMFIEGAEYDDHIKMHEYEKFGISFNYFVDFSYGFTSTSSQLFCNWCDNGNCYDLKLNTISDIETHIETIHKPLEKIFANVNQKQFILWRKNKLSCAVCLCQHVDKQPYFKNAEDFLEHIKHIHMRKFSIITKKYKWCYLCGKYYDWSEEHMKDCIKTYKELYFQLYTKSSIYYFATCYTLSDENNILKTIDKSVMQHIAHFMK